MSILLRLFYGASSPPPHSPVSHHGSGLFTTPLPITAAFHRMAPVWADQCWSPARVADLVWGACSYTTPELPCTGGCGTRGVCFFGRCRCAPGAMRAVGGGCESGGAVPLVCKVFKTKYPVKGSHTYDADQCLVHPEYGSAVIPSKRWLAAQAAEAKLWSRGGDTGSHAGVGDRAQSHVKRFDRYSYAG